MASPGPTLGQQVGLNEQGQCVGGCDDHHEEQGGANQRQGDMQDQRQGARTIDARSLVVVGWDLPECRPAGSPHSSPDWSRSSSRSGPAAPSSGRSSQLMFRPKDVIDHPIALVQNAPDQAGHHRRQDGRQEQQRLIPAREAGAGIEKQSESSGPEYTTVGRCPERTPGSRSMPNGTAGPSRAPCSSARPAVCGAAEELPVSEAEVEGAAHRIDHEDQQRHDAGEHKQQAEQRAAPRQRQPLPASVALLACPSPFCAASGGSRCPVRALAPSRYPRERWAPAERARGSASALATPRTDR